MRTKTSITQQRRRRAALNRAIKRFPSLAAFAHALGVSYQRVQYWRRAGVPPQYCRDVAAVSGGIVTPGQLREDVFG